MAKVLLGWVFGEVLAFAERAHKPGSLEGVSNGQAPS